VPVAAAVGAGVPGPPRVGHGGRGPQQPAEDQQQFIDHRPRVHAGKELSQAELGRPAERGADEDQRGSGHGHQGTVARNHQRQGDSHDRAEADHRRASESASTALGHDQRKHSGGQADGSDHWPGGGGPGRGQSRVVIRAAEGEAGTAQRPVPPERGIEQRPARRGVTRSTVATANVAISRVSGPSAVAGQLPGVSSRLVPPVHGSDRPVSVGPVATSAGSWNDWFHQRVGVR
jgi:hypothetical protein